MAAPASVTIETLNGTWTMNKKLSDDTEPILATQGVSWVARKAISIATVTLTIKQYKEGTEDKIDIEQVLTGGIQGTTEKRVLDWVDREHKDHVFGTVRGRSRFTTINKLDVDEDYMLSGWLPESEEGRVIESNAVSDENGWSAYQAWGFQEVEGQRRYVRLVFVKKGDVEHRARLIYDFIK